MKLIENGFLGVKKEPYLRFLIYKKLNSESKAYLIRVTFSAKSSISDGEVDL